MDIPGKSCATLEDQHWDDVRAAAKGASGTDCKLRIEVLHNGKESNETVVVCNSYFKVQAQGKSKEMP